MAGRLFRTLSCFSNEERSNHPRIRLSLFNFEGEHLREVEVAPVDTGFSGGILVPTVVYRFFMCGELPRELWREYASVIGPVSMRTARGFVKLEGFPEMREAPIETPLLGGGKLLVGREVLQFSRILLDGPSRISCYVAESA